MLAVPVIAGATAFLVTSSEPKQYQATSSLLMRDRQLSEVVSGYTPPYRDPTREAETNLALVSSVAVAERVEKRLPADAAEVRANAVAVTQQGGSDLVNITASSSTPASAALIANTWAKEYISFRQEADRSQIVESIAVVNRRLESLSPDQRAGAEGEKLRDQRNRLEVVSSLQTGNAELVDPALPPSSPSSPKPVRNLILAALAGFIVAVLAALLIQRFDRRIGGVEDMEEILHTRVLGDVPRSGRLRWRAGAAGGDDLSAREQEAFRVLRTNLSYFALDKGLGSVLITSAIPGEGKTTIAIHLAHAFAENGSRTLLLEADLRRPTLAVRMKLGASPGLTGILLGDAAPSRAIVRVPSAHRNGQFNDDSLIVTTPTTLLDVLPAGGTPPNPAEVLDSQTFDDLFRQLKSTYDVVIVNGPPVLGLSDTTPISRRVSGTLIVARLGVATTTNQRALHRQLSLVGARVLGLAVNETPGSGADGYYLAPDTAKLSG